MRTHLHFCSLLAPSLATLLFACGGTSEPPEETEIPVPIVPAPFPQTEATSILFERQSSRLSITAGVPSTVRVQVLPEGIYTVRFAVVGENANNLFLSHNQVETGPDGTADITIHARGTSSSEHTLRAAVGTLESPRLFLDVDQSTSATLSVQPLEPEGSVRQISEWVLSAHLDQSCADLEGTPPPDSDLNVTAPYAGPGQQVVLGQVPAGRDLALVIRAGQFASGCKNMLALIPSSLTVTEIDINQRPLHLDETALALQFGLDAATEFDTLFSEFSFRAAGAFSFDDGDDLDAVFNAMASLSSDPTAFAAARVDNAWRDTWLIQQGVALAGAGTRDLLRGWMQAGLTSLTQGNALQGVFSEPNELGEAEFVLNTAAGATGNDQGFEVVGVSTLAADANDFLRVNLSLSWLPSPFLLAAAQRQATADHPTTLSVPAALVEAFDCATLGPTLVASNPGSSTEAYAGCDANCVERLCEEGLGLIWEKVTLSALPAMIWDVTASAQAQVDNNARPSLAEGGSLNGLRVADPETSDLDPTITDISVTGTFRATASDAVAP